jgi:predicted RNase H-like HicB family nuclease
MDALRIEILIEPDEGGLHAYCPALKGLHVDGNTVEEALQNACDAVILHIQSFRTHGEPLPVRLRA